ncbi:hypothetical protein BDAP_001699 [Binucleata daphniae]
MDTTSDDSEGVYEKAYTTSQEGNVKDFTNTTNQKGNGNNQTKITNREGSFYDHKNITNQEAIENDHANNVAKSHNSPIKDDIYKTKNYNEKSDKYVQTIPQMLLEEDVIYKTKLKIIEKGDKDEETVPQIYNSICSNKTSNLAFKKIIHEHNKVKIYLMINKLEKKLKKAKITLNYEKFVENVNTAIDNFCVKRTDKIKSYINKIRFTRIFISNDKNTYLDQIKKLFVDKKIEMIQYTGNKNDKEKITAKNFDDNDWYNYFIENTKEYHFERKKLTVCQDIRFKFVFVSCNTLRCMCKNKGFNYISEYCAYTSLFYSLFDFDADKNANISNGLHTLLLQKIPNFGLYSSLLTNYYATAPGFLFEKRYFVNNFVNLQDCLLKLQVSDIKIMKYYDKLIKSARNLFTFTQNNHLFTKDMPIEHLVDVFSSEKNLSSRFYIFNVCKYVLENYEDQRDNKVSEYEKLVEKISMICEIMSTMINI